MAKEWLTIDATNRSFGRLATELAVLLQGKNKTDYSPHLQQAPNLVIINCAQLKIGERRSNQTYYRHSGHLGNLKSASFSDQPYSQRLAQAVRTMLPVNKSRNTIMKQLHCFETDQHPFNAQTHE